MSWYFRIVVAGLCFLVAASGQAETQDEALRDLRLRIEQLENRLGGAEAEPSSGTPTNKQPTARGEDDPASNPTSSTRSAAGLRPSTQLQDLLLRVQELENRLDQADVKSATVDPALDAEEPPKAPDIQSAAAEPTVADPAAIPPEWTDQISDYVDKEFPVRASYGSKGFRLETRDGNWQTNLQWRLQFRFSNPYRGDPRQVSQFEAPDETTFELRRARMKIGGHGYRPWLKYYFEVDLQPTRDIDDDSVSTSARVIDWRIDVAKWKWLGLRVGQWKIDYNRERVDSSGRQQFVERSIVNRIFTIDRQMGVSLRGRLFEETHADMRYYLGTFTGEGRGVKNQDEELMYVGRLQWNFLGRDLPLRQTDVERTELPTGTLAIGGATHTGRPTRWSSSGGGNLDGFERSALAENGQYRIHQAVVETAFKWQGFSWQNEWHWKNITDRELMQGDPGRKVDLYGVYAQAGYFFNEIFDWYPEPLELAFRYAWLQEPNAMERDKDNERSEYTAGANWFFAGHNNKITLDYSYLTLDDSVLDRDVSDHRVRLQWDISF